MHGDAPEVAENSSRKCFATKALLPALGQGKARAARKLLGTNDIMATRSRCRQPR